jgi:hypothetical protein
MCRRASWHAIVKFGTRLSRQICDFQAGGTAGTGQMQLGLAHRALQTEHQPVVEIGRVVDTVRILSVARIAASLEEGVNLRHVVARS